MEVVFHKPKMSGSRVIAFADVTLVDIGLTLRSFCIRAGINGTSVTVPSKAVVIGGDTRYVKQVVFDSEQRREEFLGEVLRLWNAFREMDALR
jgi:hypothetical protein